MEPITVLCKSLNVTSGFRNAVLSLFPYIKLQYNKFLKFILQTVLKHSVRPIGISFENPFSVADVASLWRHMNEVYCKTVEDVA